ncbi:predicted protein [Thalassiosira pseudonana CCMP1335]|uniref:Uncharacterized protein n=1 Tax=Thalassiosira pseudonana TaxID=35128 RepID=B8BR02_THAPS|nr:predicted protein [Thalassiosira pseudonana CCMP1335]EED95878.1 predicted protein [Thalassiosira pseudonana CCMP1335]
MSSMSRLIPLAARGGAAGGRARSASPIATSSTGGGHPSSIGGARTFPLRSVSPLASFLPTSNTIIGSISDSRGYSTALLPPLGRRNSSGLLDTVVGQWEKKSSLIRSFSDVSVPMAPTSNHPHKKLPGAKGQLIYTET